VNARSAASKNITQRGTLPTSHGTSEIMLRSKQLGLRMSDRVGKYLSGNGDILAFGYNMDRDANVIGRELPIPNRPVGPTITGMIDCRC
jgi:hypothetical protein